MNRDPILAASKRNRDHSRSMKLQCVYVVHAAADVSAGIVSRLCANRLGLRKAPSGFSNYFSFQAGNLSNMFGRSQNCLNRDPMFWVDRIVVWTSLHFWLCTYRERKTEKKSDLVGGLVNT